MEGGEMKEVKPYTEEEIEDLQASFEEADPPMKLFEARWLATVNEAQKHIEELRHFAHCVYCGDMRKHDGTPEGLRLLMLDHIEKCDKHPIRKMAEAMEDACSHLGVALSQSIPKDDQIIMGHVRDAFILLGGKA
jgi:hypothetical protein